MTFFKNVFIKKFIAFCFVLNVSCNLHNSFMDFSCFRTMQTVYKTNSAWARKGIKKYANSKRTINQMAWFGFRRYLNKCRDKKIREYVDLQKKNKFTPFFILNLKGCGYPKINVNYFQKNDKNYFLSYVIENLLIAHNGCKLRNTKRLRVWYSRRTVNRSKIKRELVYFN